MYLKRGRSYEQTAQLFPKPLTREFCIYLFSYLFIYWSTESVVFFKDLRLFQTVPQDREETTCALLTAQCIISLHIDIMPMTSCEKGALG